MKTILKITLYTALAVGVCICIFFPYSCSGEGLSELKGSKLSYVEMDSVQDILVNKHNPFLIYEYIEELEARLHQVEGVSDPLLTARAFRLIAYYHLVMFDYDKTYEFQLKARKIFEDHGLYEEILGLDKTIAMAFRQGGEIDSMEPFLLRSIDLAEEKGVKSYHRLFPIHELAVHYSYDLGRCEDAIKYAELFFNELERYASKGIKEERFLNIVNYDTDVLYLELGQCYAEIGDFDKAKLYLDKAKKEYGDLSDVGKLSRVHKNYLNYFLKTRDYKNSEYHKNLFYNYSKKYTDTLVKRERFMDEVKTSFLEKEKELELSEEKGRTRLMISISAFVMACMAFFGIVYLQRQQGARREMRARLEKEREFNSLKTSLFMNVAHDARTPLTLILGNLELFMKAGSHSGRARKYYEETKKNCSDVLRKVTDTLHLLKNEMYDVPVNNENVMLEPFFRNCFFSFESVAEIKSISLDYSAKFPKNFVVSVDREKLESILKNLVDNAIKYSPKGHSVGLSAELAEGRAVIRVADSGIGMGPEEREGIFKKFYRAKEDDSADGFGIGLAIVKNLTKVLNGTISVESEKGKGSTFILELPVSQGEVSELPVETVSVSRQGDALGEGPKGSGRQSVLVVDDNAGMCNYYNDILSENFDCSFAFNGEEAVKMLEGGTYNLIITDVMMPVMDGFQLRKWILDTDKANIPFMMVTAVEQEVSKIEAFRLGVDDYLVKPFNREELEARVSRLLRNWKNRKKRVSHNVLGEPQAAEGHEEKVLKRINEFVFSNIENDQLKVENLAEEAGISKRQLFRLMKKATGLSPNQYVLEARLQEAYKKIKYRQEPNIKNVMYSVGITSPSYFSVRFKKRFGISPSEIVSG